MDQPKVFVNGRELTATHLEAFKQIYGAIPAPGHDLGPLAAARSGGGGRAGGGGDNTWSGLVGAGNYNDDNTVGSYGM